MYSKHRYVLLSFSSRFQILLRPEAPVNNTLVLVLGTQYRERYFRATATCCHPFHLQGVLAAWIAGSPTVSSQIVTGMKPRILHGKRESDKRKTSPHRPG